MSLSVGIIGGGASGMAAAIAAAREGADVTILERNDSLGKKLLVTGNGKCNLGNYDLNPTNYYGDNDFVINFLKQFHTGDNVAFWNSCGLLLKERNGYLYPKSEQAVSVLDALLVTLRTLKVEIITNFWVKKIRRTDNGKVVLTAGGEEYSFDRVIIACGGEAAPKTGSDGGGYYLAKQLDHTINPPLPALVQIKCKDKWCSRLSGVRADAAVFFYDAAGNKISEHGEIQFTDYGLSGIPVFQVSRIIAGMLQNTSEVKLYIDLFPECDVQDFEQTVISERAGITKGRNAKEYFQGLYHTKIVDFLLYQCKISPEEKISQISGDRIKECLHYSRNIEFTAVGTNSFASAQVTAGGIPTSEINADFESLKMPHVYFAGEVLDVDGKCGGYNLHFAWGSGIIAGKSAAGRAHDQN